MWALNKESSEPLYQQLVKLIVDKVMTQEILAGEKLPSERKMANLLNVNRSTVTSAYAELEALNYVSRIKGSGTIVNQVMEHSEGVNWQRYFSKDSQAPFSQFIEEIAYLKEKKGVIDAYSGDLSLSQYPNYQLPQLTYNDFLLEESNQPQGLADLRIEIKKIVAEELQLELLAEELLITAGGQQSLFLIINALLKPKDVVVIEEPSYFYSMPIFKEKGIKTIAIPYTKTGFDWQQLEKVFRENHVKLFFINPTYQNPTGKTLEVAERKKLIALCKKYQVVIVEDDVFGLLGYPSQKIVPKLKKLSPETVIYLGSLSKIVGQTLKIGWIAAPKGVINELVKVHTKWEQEVGVLPQVMAMQLLKQSSFRASLTTLRIELERKMQEFINLLVLHFEATTLTFERPQGGYYIWLTFKERVIYPKEWQALIKHENVLVLPSFLIEASAQSVRINVGRLNVKEMERVIFALKKWLINKN